MDICLCHESTFIICILRQKILSFVEKNNPTMFLPTQAVDPVALFKDIQFPSELQ